MPNARLIDMDAAPGAPNATDLVEGVRDPAGTPLSEVLTWDQVAQASVFSSRYHEKGGTDVPVTDGGTGSSTAAGARTNLAVVGTADTSTAGFGFVVDEDNFASNSATKVSTQQATKAYVDSVATTLTTSYEADDAVLASDIAALDTATDTALALKADKVNTLYRVEYTGSAWPARPTLPDGAAVLWVNRTDSTAPASGAGGYIAGTDLLLTVVVAP